MSNNTTTLSKQKIFSSPSRSLFRRTALFFITFIVVLILLQIQALKHPFSFPSPASSWSILHQWKMVVVSTPQDRDCARKLDRAESRLRDTVTFLPLKDLRFAETPMSGNTWFMSSLDGTYELGESSRLLHFPSEASKGRLLCLAGNDGSNGTRNSYALAWPGSLPHNATLLGGLTFVSDIYYDYGNLWHGQSFMLPFAWWHESRGCASPARWVLFHWGELRTSVGNWLRTLMEITFSQQVEIEDFRRGGGGPTCFEEAVVVRNNEGSISTEKRGEVYDMMRCKARAFCNVSVVEEEEDVAGDEKIDERGAPPAGVEVRMTLLLRKGRRSFRNESTVIDIFKRACDEVDGCRLTVAWPHNLTFCDQVKVLSATDVLVSQHGAQMTNMFFMDRNSSVMEFFPKGWLEFAGPGQYVFQWMAAYTGMRHQGVWRDSGDGDPCPYADEKDPRCFSKFYKDRQLGHDEAYFANWSTAVLNQMREYKSGEASRSRARRRSHGVCPCG